MASCPKCGAYPIRKRKDGWFKCRRCGPIRKALGVGDSVSEVSQSVPVYEAEIAYMDGEITKALCDGPPEIGTVYVWFKLIDKGTLVVSHRNIKYIHYWECKP